MWVIVAVVVVKSAKQLCQRLFLEESDTQKKEIGEIVEEARLGQDNRVAIVAYWSFCYPTTLLRVDRQ